MILFDNDWRKYPDAIVDTSTRNVSYLRLAKILEKMGVKNRYAHLSLLNPKLKGVDPFDEDNLTLEQKVMIKEECELNPWYALREIIRIPSASGGEAAYFKINRGAFAAWWNYFNHQTYNQTQPRQTGKSTTTNVLVAWLLFFKYRGSRIFLLTKDAKLRTENVEAIKKIQDLLPSYLNPKNRSDLSNTEVITCAKYRNKLITAVPQNSEGAANKIGRGMTCATYITDEGPFINYLEKSLRSMLAGGIEAMPAADRAGMPWGIIYTTTAGSKADADGLYYYKMISGGVVWDESFLDLSHSKEYREMVNRNKTGITSIVNITMSHTQLGFTNEWLKNIIETFGITGDEADKDLFNVWSDGSFQSPLNKKVAQLIRASEEKPKHIEFTPQGYIINWYIPKETIARRMANGKYVIGLDTSEVVGRDGIGFFVIDSSSLETICTLSISESNILTFIEYITSFMIKYENTILIPERRSTGSTVIAGLLIAFRAKGIDPFKRIYNTLVDEGKHLTKDGKQLIQEVRSKPDQADKAIRLFGFATSGSGEHSRSGLYLTILTRAASYSGPILKDKKTIEEVLSLTKKNNRIDHSVLGHDDCVIAWLLTIWFLTSSRNLDYYGVSDPLGDAVDHLTRLRYSTDDGRVDEARIKQTNEEQKKIREQIDEYLTKIKSTSDEILLLRYEANLYRLERKLIRTDGDVMSITDMIKQAKEKRNKRR